MRSDNFLLCVGAQRGGTTWLAEQLWPHPAFSFPPKKELRYFDLLYVRDFDAIQSARLREFRRALWNKLGKEPKTISSAIARDLRWQANYALVSRELYDDTWYESLFREADPTKWTGDFSPSYSLLPDEGIAHMHRLLPDARIIFMMRDPVDRTWSGSTYPLRLRKGLSKEEALAAVRHNAKTALQRDFSDYRAIIERYRKYYRRDQFCICFHDDIKTAPESVLESIFSYLGVPFDRGGFPKIENSVNRSPELEKDPAVIEDLSREYLDLLKWLRDEFGGPAERWYANAMQRLS